MRRMRVRSVRRPSRKRSKRDVLSLSVSFDQVAVIRDPGAPTLGPNAPAADAIVLVHGGKWTEAGLSTQASATALQDTAGRGVSVRGIQFDWTGFTTCWIDQGSPSGDQGSHIVQHYMAIVKAEFDQEIYENSGLVVPRWQQVPNIVRAPRDIVLGGFGEPAFDPPVDILWRGLEEAIARPCLDCPPCPQEVGCSPPDPESCNTNFLGVQGIMVTGKVNLPTSHTAFQAMSRNYAMRHVKLRTGRFLKEEECLVLVSNWVTTIPQNSQLVWSNSIYGTMAVRIAR